MSPRGSRAVRVELEPARTALIVVDVQNDFCHEDGYFAKIGFDVEPCSHAADRLREVVDAARERTMHVVWTMSTNEAPPRYELPPARFRGAQDGRPADQFVPGTWGWQIVDELEPDRDELVVEKPRYDAFLRTTLEEDLRRRGVDTVVIGGVITNCCVDTTARSAFMRGFGVAVLEDCVGTFGQEHDLHVAALRNLDLLFAVVTDRSVLAGTPA
jgi:ureidoacrylate peracid hydrolase